MNTLRSSLIVSLVLWVLGAGLAPGQDVDPEKALSIASVNGKYSQLLAVLPVKEDRERYGDFHDHGLRPGGTYQAHTNTPRGYWVWVAPNWYVWARRHMKPKGLMQVTGVPDTDFRIREAWTTAWHAKPAARGRTRQLEVLFAGPVDAAVVVVFVSDANSVARLDLVDPDDRHTNIALIAAPFKTSPHTHLGVHTISPRRPIERIRLFFRSGEPRQPIAVDAVGLLDRYGRMHWATGASTRIVSRIHIQAKKLVDEEEELIEEEEVVEEEEIKPSRVKDPVRLPAPETAIENALDWLARHQTPGEGFWDVDAFFEHAGSPADGMGYPLYDPGVTGLAVLAYLGAGYTHQKGKYQKVLAEAIRYLKRIQDPEGCFGTQVGHFMYSHIIATLALSEAYGKTRSPLLRQPVEKGVAFILKAQNPDPVGRSKLAWRYTVQPGDNDSSVTVWAVMALKSARAAGLKVEGYDEAIQGARKWIAGMTDPGTGRVGYVQAGISPVRAPGRHEKWPRSFSESITAAALVIRVFTGEDLEKSDPIQRGIKLVRARLPVWDEKRGTVDPYFWYYGTLICHQAGGNTWKRWCEPLGRAVLSHQVADGPHRGSWNPVGPWGEDGGRVYMTAILTLCLEVYHRHMKGIKK